MTLDEVAVGDEVLYRRPGVGVYRCQVLAVKPGASRPITLKPLTMGHPSRAVAGRPIAASMTNVVAKAARST